MLKHHWTIWLLNDMLLHRILDIKLQVCFEEFKDIWLWLIFGRAVATQLSAEVQTITLMQHIVSGWRTHDYSLFFCIVHRNPDVRKVAFFVFHWGNFQATSVSFQSISGATSGQLSGNYLDDFLTTFGQRSDNFRTTFGQLSGNFQTTCGQLILPP